MNAREEILGGVRAALADVTEPDPALDVPIAWEYAKPTPMPDVLARFVEMCEDYKATVVRCDTGSVAGRIADLLGSAGVHSVVLPSGMEQTWRQAIESAGIAVHDDDPPLSRAELNVIDGVVTAAAVGIAETGTIVLDHAADQGRRALSLVPDLHVCVISSDQVVSDVPEAVVRLQASIDERLPLTWISGPSATSDIELSRVEGVHGPRILHVLLVNV